MRNNVLLFMIVVFMLLSLGSVNANTFFCNITSPVTSGDIRSGNFTVNITITGANVTDQPTGIGFNITSIGGTVYPGRFATNQTANTTSVVLAFPASNLNSFSDQQVTLTALGYASTTDSNNTFNFCAVNSTATKQLVIDASDIAGSYDTGSPASLSRITTSGGGNFSASSDSNQEILRGWLYIGSQDRLLMTNTTVNRTQVSLSPTRLQVPEKSHETYIRLEDTDGSTVTDLAVRFVVFDYTETTSYNPLIAEQIKQKASLKNIALVGIAIFLLLWWFGWL